jgi:regulator of replication initiation timing
MKISILFIIGTVGLFAVGCGGSSTNSHEHDSDSDSSSTNQALYDQIMDIHDEVMPKSQDIYDLKKLLKDKIAATPDMVVEERQKLEQRIAKLDSVDKMMMDWMHNFSPLPDSIDQEAAREYLESEMEKIRKVKDAMLEAVASEKGSN